MPSRRDFLHLSCLAAPGLLALLPRLHRARPHRAAPALALFFAADALPALQERFANDALFAALRERLAALDRPAARRFLSSEVRYNDHLYHIKQVSDTAQQMAFYFAMTGDEDAASLAMEAIRTLMQFPKWDYFLEDGEHVIGLQRAPGATLAVALAADWLGEAVDAQERAAWLRTMGERGCEPSFRSLFGMRHPDRVVGWSMDPTSTYLEHRPGDVIDLSNWPVILDRTNLKAVPASALAVGTVAYQQQFGHDADTDRWLEQATYSLGTFQDLFAPDGSYAEGVSYAHYTTLHLAQAIAALQRQAGVDLYDLVNWPGYVTYLHEMTMPTGTDPHAIINFGDAGDGATSAVPFWIAGRSRDRRARWFGQTLAGTHDEWSLIWYPPAVTPEAPPASPRLWKSDLDWIVGRTGYGPVDLVVAMRSGSPANHEHADRGSLVVKCFGEQLVTDPYRPPYSFTDPAWMMRTTAGHSALLIDGHGHQYHDGSEGTNASEAAAHIVRSGLREGFFFWTSDATPAYQLVHPDVRSVTRTVVVLHALPAVLVLDKILKQEAPSRLQARFFGYNLDGNGHIEAAGTSFRTYRPGAALYGTAFAREGVHLRTAQLPIPEETARLHPFAEAATQTPGLEPLLVTVLMPERGRGGQAAAQIRPLPDEVYEIELENDTRPARCRIFDTGTIPEFEVDV